MNSEVLVTYASKYGATAEIAEKIRQVITEKGISAVLSPIKQVRDLSVYEAVIIGSAVYIGSWRKDAAAFIKNNASTLAGKKTWIFSSGPTGAGDPGTLTSGWEYPKSLESVMDTIDPRDITVFHGAASEEKMNFLEKWMLNKVRAPKGDFRDWNSISLWAEQIVDALKT